MLLLCWMKCSPSTGLKDEISKTYWLLFSQCIAEVYLFNGPTKVSDFWCNPTVRVLLNQDYISVSGLMSILDLKCPFKNCKMFIFECPSKYKAQEHLGQYLGFIRQSKNMEMNVNVGFCSLLFKHCPFSLRLSSKQEWVTCLICPGLRSPGEGGRLADRAEIRASRATDKQAARHIYCMRVWTEGCFGQKAGCDSVPWVR